MGSEFRRMLDRLGMPKDGSVCPKCRGERNLLFNSLRKEIVRCHVCEGKGWVPYKPRDEAAEAKRREVDARGVMQLDMFGRPK